MKAICTQNENCPIHQHCRCPPLEVGTEFELLAKSLGKLVDEKNRQYGDSAAKSGAILRILYPEGVRADQYDDALLMVRVLDKLSRISRRGLDGVDLGGESPWQDISGYGLIGTAMDERRK